MGAQTVIALEPGHGVHAHSFLQTLIDMYTNWAELQEYKCSVGSDGVMKWWIRIEADALDRLSGETGVHRYEAQGDDERRFTSFVNVAVSRELPEFGPQVRNYVRDPYTLVKDLRTDVETTDLDAVFGGHIDMFLNGN